MGSRLTPNSNIFIPNFGRHYYMVNPQFGSGIPINMNPYANPYPPYQQQQQQQQPQHILTNTATPQPQQPQSTLTLPQNILNTNTNTNSVNISTTSNISNSTSTTTSTSKTNTPYTNFTIKNLDQSSNYFSECTHKDFQGQKKNVKSVGWNCDGKKLAGGSYDNTTRVWNIDPSSNRTTKELELKGHTESVESLSWHPLQSDILATTSSDKTVRIWDTRSGGKAIGVINSQVENINLAWFPDGSLISTGSKDDLINIYDTKTLKPVKNIKFQDEVNEFGWDSKGELFLLTTGLGTIEVYKYQAKTNDLKFLKIVNAHTANIYCIDFHPQLKYFAVGSADSIVSLWDIEEMCCIKTFTKQSFPIRSISFSFDGQFLASSSEDIFVDIAHVESGQSVHQINSDTSSNSIAWSPNQPILAIALEGKENNQKETGIVRVFGFHS